MSGDNCDVCDMWNRSRARLEPKRYTLDQLKQIHGICKECYNKNYERCVHVMPGKARDCAETFKSYREGELRAKMQMDRDESDLRRKLVNVDKVRMAMGMKPTGAAFPRVPMAAPGGVTKRKFGLSRKASKASKRCKAMTKQGKRCKKSCVNNRKAFCTIHS